MVKLYDHVVRSQSNCTAEKAGQKDLSYKEMKWISVGRKPDKTIIVMLNFPRKLIISDNYF